ncbi:ribonuclease H-like domain-containing protein [Tanacetum coccineum]
MWNNVANIPSFIPKAASVPAGSRNRPASIPAGSRNRPSFCSYWVEYCDLFEWEMAKLGKGPIRTSILNFENVYYVEEFKNFNFQVVLKVPRRNNLYCFNLSDIKPERDVTCLLAKTSLAESTKWHRRMAHVNFKNMNKLAKHGLVNGLPSKLFTNEHNCVLATKDKQLEGLLSRLITVVEHHFAPLQLLHMDLFGPTSIRSIDHKELNPCLIETFCGSKGILERDFCNARTPQTKWGCWKERNRTLIEAARTMLADSKLPTMFWTEAVSTACYVLNRVLVTKPHNKTPYELVYGKRSKASRKRVPADKVDTVCVVFSDGPTEFLYSFLSFRPLQIPCPHLPENGGYTTTILDTNIVLPLLLMMSLVVSVSNLEPSVVLDSVPTRGVITIHPQSQILGDLLHCSERACPSTRWKKCYWDKMDSEEQKRCQRMWPYTDDKVLILGWLSVFSGGARVPTGSVTGSYWYAITHDPIIYDSLVKQFWSTASLRASEEGPPAILATIDRTPYTITESLVRSQLQLDDAGGVEDLPIADIYLGMDNLGYPSEGKLTFFKNKFSPQWRFLQMILEIEPKNTKQYHAFKLTSKMFANMRLNFQGDHMPLLGTMLPPAQAAIAGESSGEAAPSNPQTVPETITEPDHSHDHESTPPRPTTSTSGAPVNEPGPSSDPNIASSSRPHESAPDQFTSTNVEDETMGGSFQTSPPRSTQAPPEGTTSGGAEDLDKLTALSTLVSTLMQKVNTQESELNAHKLLFKEVVGKLAKKVKLLVDKLKGRKRKFVMTDSDIEEDAEQDVDPLIKLAKAAATIAADSAVLTGGSHEDDIPPSSNIPSGEFAGGSDVPTGATPGPSADPFNKGKSPLIEEDPQVKERSFRQREEDRLGEEAARRMYEEEKAELEREREELQRKRQQDVLNSAKYYTNTDWNDIMGQVHVNQGLTADLLGPDVTKDNFAERMVALIAKRRREFAAQSSTIYTTGWTMKHVKSFSDAQLKTEFDKIRTAAADLQSQNLRRSLKRPGANLEQASSKKSKSTEAPKPDDPADSQQPSVEVSSQKAPIDDVEVPSTTTYTPKKVGTRKKQLGRKGVHPSHSTIPIEDGDPEAEHKMCLKYASNADSASDDDTPINLHAVVDWELLPTGLGWINVIYRKDNSRKCFTSLREILHLVTTVDLMTIYGRVMTFYQDQQAAGVGLVLWGDLKVLIDSPEVNDGSDVWKNQNTWSIQSWKLYSYSGVHVLEAVHGLMVHMFVDKRYPLSANLIERILDHQLEICQDTVGNELTTAVQLIAFLKKQISDSRRPKVHDCPCLDADFLVAVSKFMMVAFGDGFKMLLFNPLVISTKDLSRNLKLTMSNSSLGEDFPTGKDSSIVSTGRTKVIPAGSTILVLVVLCLLRVVSKVSW